MNIPCPTGPNVCAPPPGDSSGDSAFSPFALSLGENPISNFSSEKPDVDIFIGTHFGNPDIPWTPPGGSLFVVQSCLGFCVSAISQADAQLCAAAASLVCENDNNNDPFDPRLNPQPKNDQGGVGNNPQTCTAPCGPTVTIPAGAYHAATQEQADAMALEMACIKAETFNQLCANTAQSCTANCPDGLPFSVGISAGVYRATTQAQADAIALSAACKLAEKEKICFGELTTTEICRGATYSSPISVTTINPPVEFESVTPLPAGLSLTKTGPTTALLSGVPTLGGTYTFSIRAFNQSGQFMVKTFQIGVADIFPTTLPDGEIGVAYDQDLVRVAATTPVVFSIESGALPDGLALTQTNFVSCKISGTPTNTGTFAFRIKMEGPVVTCFRNYGIEIEDVAGCPEWDAMLWDTETTGTAGTGTASGTFLFEDFQEQVNSPAGLLDGTENFAAIQNSTLPPDGLIYNGPGCNCNLHVDFLKSAGNQSQLGGNGVLVMISPPGITLASFAVTNADGSYDIPFVVPDTLGADINLFVTVDIQSGIDPGVLADSSMLLTGFVENLP